MWFQKNDYFYISIKFLCYVIAKLQLSSQCPVFQSCPLRKLYKMCGFWKIRGHYQNHRVNTWKWPIGTCFGDHTHGEKVLK